MRTTKTQEKMEQSGFSGPALEHMTLAVGFVNNKQQQKVFVMNGGSKLPLPVVPATMPFGLTAFGETFDSETVDELFGDVLEAFALIAMGAAWATTRLEMAATGQ